MSFNSIDFVLFFAAIFVIYWILKNKTATPQNIFLLIASYIFYGLWDIRFIPLLIGISGVNFLIGNQIELSVKRSKSYLVIGILFNLLILLIFKYFNFFIESFEKLFALESNVENFNTIQIILPLGLSFFSLQCVGYLVDVYHEKIKASQDPIKFSLFVCFFPQLVAGPIERAKNLLPQFSQSRTFNYDQSIQGVYFILWGFFKKLVIADNCAIIANFTFSDYSNQSGWVLYIGLIAFGIQIYCDFSGYSDIAIGCAKMLGIELKPNFLYPYFSKNIKEFWRKWHISLSSWFRDYLYIPLGGNKGTITNHAFVLVLVFTLSGLWHGPSINFILWGIFHSIIYLLFHFINLKKEFVFFNSFKPYLDLISTFFLVNLGWVFFRANDFQQAKEYLNQMCSDFFISSNMNPFLFTLKNEFGILMTLLLVLFILVEFLGRKMDNPLLVLNKYPRWLKYSFFYLLLLVIYIFNGSEQKFIYFQF